MKKIILIISVFFLLSFFILVPFISAGYISNIDMCDPKGANTTAISLNRAIKIYNGNHVFHYTYTGHKIDIFYTYISSDETFYIKYDLDCVGSSTRGTIKIESWKFKDKENSPKNMLL